MEEEEEDEGDGGGGVTGMEEEEEDEGDGGGGLPESCEEQEHKAWRDSLKHHVHFHLVDSDDLICHSDLALPACSVVRVQRRWSYLHRCRLVVLLNRAVLEDADNKHWFTWQRRVRKQERELREQWNSLGNTETVHKVGGAAMVRG
eukprot:765251-Hanusia_phi.AAC.1